MDKNYGQYAWPYSPQVAMSLCPPPKIKRQNKFPKLFSRGFIFLTTLYIFMTMFGDICSNYRKLHLQVKKLKKKKSPQVFIITPRQKEITQSFPGRIFLRNLSLLGPFGPNKRKNGFSVKIRLC